MKKNIFVLSFIFVLVILSGCAKESNEKVKVLIPAGAPTLGFVQMIHDDKEILDYDMTYESVSGPDLLVSAITSKSHQIVVAPTNIGAKLYGKSPDYVYAGTLTFGNLYLVSSEEMTIDDLENETIYAFGQGGTPEILLRKVLGDKNVDIQFLSSVNDVNGGFNAGNYKVVLLAEPILSVVKAKKDVYTVLDLQEEYQKLSGSSSYPQSGVFINKDFASKNEKFVEKFLEKLQSSVQYVNSEKESASDYYIEEELLPQLPKQVLINSIPGSHIEFLNSDDSKPLLEDYFNMILTFKKELIGGKLPNDDFYLG
ncbi:ABC transporter substrate-binding protein [Mycoplasmatota bacterium]|nr:ABC transporter substrate-binding protein [Mycoplasmatota bacterium]